MIMDDIPIFIGVRSSNHLYTTFALGIFFFEIPFQVISSGCWVFFWQHKRSN